jgi:hypothetical protein
MKIGDYDVNPYAALGGGLLGAGLGLGAYALDSNKTKKKLATYAAIGASLGLGTGALASLTPHMTDTEKAKAAAIAKASDVDLNPINMGFRAMPSALGFAGGYGTSRIGRELAARKIPASAIKAAVREAQNNAPWVPKQQQAQNGIIDLVQKTIKPADVIDDVRRARLKDLVRGDKWWASALGLGKGSGWKMLGRGAADLGGGVAGAVGFNLANNFLDWI